MGNLLERVYKPVNGSNTLGTGDTTKDVIAAPGATKLLCINRLNISVLVSAAQTLTVQSSDGTVVLYAFPASPGITQIAVQLPDRGVELPLNNALVVVSGAAGPSAFVRAAGVIKG